MTLPIHGALGGSLGVGTPGLDRRGDTPPPGGRPADAGRTSANEAPASNGARERSSIDPRLWEALSADERAFYLRHAGPITYGPGAGRSPVTLGARLGTRIDVRG